MKKSLLKLSLIIGLIAVFSGCNGKIIAGDIGNNDTIDSAGSFNADGSSFTGDIGGSFDIMDVASGEMKFDVDRYDWYKHTASADGFFYVTFKLSAQASDNISLIMYKGANKVETKQTYSTSKELTYAIKQKKDEVYYFQVFNDKNTGKIEYTMSGKETTSFTDTAETTTSNDDEGTAQVLTGTDLKITGNGNNSTDRYDYYKFTAKSDGLVMMNLKEITISTVKTYIHGNSTYAIDGNMLSFETKKDITYTIYVDSYDTDSEDLAYTLYLHIQ